MSGETIRCHPSVIVERSLPILLVLVVLIVQFDQGAIAPALGVPLVGLLLFNYRQWSRMTIRFNETDVVVERDTLFKVKKTLPYAKIG